MRDLIEIDKSEIPCQYDIELGAEEFSLLFKYNAVCDMFTVTLSRTDENEEDDEDVILVHDEPLVYGVPLFQDVADDEFPCLEIVPYDESGSVDEVTWENFGEKVFLTIDDGEESEE